MGLGVCKGSITGAHPSGHNGWGELARVPYQDGRLTVAQQGDQGCRLCGLHQYTLYVLTVCIYNVVEVI